MYIEYWLNQKSSNPRKSQNGDDLNKFHLSSSSSKNLEKKFKINLMIKLSPKFSFMLVFKIHDLHFQQVADGKSLNSTAQVILSDFLPDVSDGFNKYFIYCEELERVLIGDTSAELLSIVPID